MEQVDLAIVGAGLVGLATALALRQSHPHLSLVVLEQEGRTGQHQSSHNSGVIHSGIYYQPGSLKARLCLSGARSMVAFCEAENVHYHRCGKIIVATRESELDRLKALYERGRSHDIPGLRLLAGPEIQELEPHSSGLQAIYVPTTAVVDFGKVAAALTRRVVKSGGQIRLGWRVVSAQRERSVFNRGLILETPAGEIRTRYLVNCAGLWSDPVAGLLGDRGTVRIVPFRGEYRELTEARRDLVRALIYPVPDPALPFLGVHLSREVDGRVLAGPNAVLALARAGYRARDVSLTDTLELMADRAFWRMVIRYWRVGVAEIRRWLDRWSFLKEAQRLLPALTASDLTTGMSGVRAQAVNDRGELVDDFQFVEREDALHVLNAPSPAATASLAIGNHLAARATVVFQL